jgi:hypothetical protein
MGSVGLVGRALIRAQRSPTVHISAGALLPIRPCVSANGPAAYHASQHRLDGYGHQEYLRIEGGNAESVMRSALVYIAIVTLAASSAWSQGNPVGAAPRQAPIGHRQPTVKDLPPDVARDEQPAAVAPERPTEIAPLSGGRNAGARADGPSRGQNVRARAGGPPTLNVDPSCVAAGMGAVVLGRDKKACLADETTAQDTLKQNWPKYLASDKSDCVNMVTTGGPASYVELLSCVEILRDARNIRNADALEADNSTVSRFRRRK